jgi:hypothetical protein
MRPLAAVALVALLLPVASAIRACVASAAPGAVVRAPGDGGFTFAISRSLFPSPAPAWHVEVANADHIAAVVRCANAAGVKVCPRTGGHSFTGKAHCTGVMVDVVKMKSFTYNAGSGEITVGAGNTLGEMFYKTTQASGGSRMIGIGLCPSVGVGGYVLGGGFNPYSGLTGLTCESAVSFDMVMADGSKKTVTASSDPELFWASCGGGGGSFSILTGLTLRTAPAAKFNNNVHFRYRWPITRAGEALNKFVDYGNENGNVWVRLELSLDDGIVAYGACWDSPSVANCESRLRAAEFFNVPGRQTIITRKSSRVGDFQRYIGPAGRWARQLPTISEEEAFVGTNYKEAGVALKRTYTSGFWRFGGNKPSVAVFQRVADILYGADRTKLGFMLAQFNPWEGAQKANAEKYAFAHRDMDAFTEFIGGKDDAQGAQIQETQAELARVHYAILQTLSEWKAGIYVNYPEFGLEANQYEYLYWGKNLQRLATLRRQVDPNNVFDGKHPMPSGMLKCPGTLAITGSGNSRNVLIQGYPYGQLSGMSAEIQTPPGCTLSGAQRATLSSKGGGKYEAVVDGGAAFSVSMSASTCSLSVVTINGIACPAGATTRQTIRLVPSRSRLLE